MKITVKRLRELVTEVVSDDERRKKDMVINTGAELYRLLARIGDQDRGRIIDVIVNNLERLKNSKKDT
jgi:hypothetical protein